jgi:hypothetical protein
VDAGQNPLANLDSLWDAKRDASTKKNAELRKKSEELNAIVKQIAKEKGATKKATLTKTKDALEKDKAKLETEKITTDTDKTDAEKKRNAAREEKLAKEKVVGLKQRAKWSLRSKELKDVIDNLEADKKIVVAFEIAGASMKMPAVV